MGREPMNAKPLSIKNDIVFKAVFGREDPICKLILSDLLNAILALEGNRKIQELVYKNPFNLQTATTDKLSIMDIKVKTGQGEWIDIEIQVNGLVSEVCSFSFDQC